MLPGSQHRLVDPEVALGVLVAVVALGALEALGAAPAHPEVEAGLGDP